jgi:hypothetical protein
MRLAALIVQLRLVLKLIFLSVNSQFLLIQRFSEVHSISSRDIHVRGTWFAVAKEVIIHGLIKY